jgi:hypothetical protein
MTTEQKLYLSKYGLLEKVEDIMHKYRIEVAKPMTGTASQLSNKLKGIFFVIDAIIETDKFNKEEHF